jgi:hypothetical protein
MSRSEQLPPVPGKPSTKGGERLAAIVDAAEQAALRVIDDAEEEARRYLEEAQARADMIVAERLREAADLLERADGDVPPQLRLHRVEPDPVPAEEEEAELREVPAPEPSSPAGGGSAAARLLATQMAVSGAGREEIEMRLRNGFQIEDTSEILDAILGPEG